MSTPRSDSTSWPRKKSPTAKPWTPQRSACGRGVPVGAFVPDTVVVIGRLVEGLSMGLLVRDPLVGRDEEAGMKTIEDDTVMLVSL
jgi:hypothetical protein